MMISAILLNLLISHRSKNAGEAKNYKATWATAAIPSSGDIIQKAARSEGMFFEGGKPSPEPFSSFQAKRCLLGKKVIFAGDSYNKQAFIGLVDILTGIHSNQEILDGHQRMKQLHATIEIVKKKLRPKGIDLEWVCSKQDECYGESGKLYKCVKCLRKHPADAVILSTGIHLINAAREHARAERARLAAAGTPVSYHEAEQEDAAAVMNATIHALSSLQNVVWGTAPKFVKVKIPVKYRETMPLTSMEHVYHRTLRVIEASKGRIRLIDYHRITDACPWDNCTIDGGHRARFVNRGKAQAILGLLCPEHK